LREKFVKNCEFSRRLQQIRAPLFENCTDPIGIFFCDKDVETGFDFEECGIQRALRPIEGMQMKIARREQCPLRRESKKLGKGAGTKSSRNQGCGGPLTTSLEKVASAKIDRWLTL